MVKTIAKTYSLENDQIKKSVTFSTEKSISSQSPTSDSSNAPVKYGFSDQGIGIGCGSGTGIRSIGFGEFIRNDPALSQSPTSYSSNTPVGYAWIFGWFEKSLLDEIANKWENLFEHRSYLVGTDIPLPSHQSPTSYRKEAGVCRDECNGPYVECLEECNRDKDCEDYCKAKVSGCMRSCLQNRDEPNDAPVNYYSEVIF